jgi:hypothetical protein
MDSPENEDFGVISVRWKGKRLFYNIIKRVNAFPFSHTDGVSGAGAR